MTIEYWRDENRPGERTAWDAIVLGGVVLPGRIRVKVIPRRDIKINKEKKKDGFTVSDDGYPGAEITITQTLFQEEHWNLMLQSRDVFHPAKPGAVKTPLEVDYPSLTYFRITHLIVKEIEMSTPEDGGTLDIVYRCHEWFDGLHIKDTTTGPPKQKSNPDGSDGGDPDFSVPPPDPANTNTQFP